MNKAVNELIPPAIEAIRNLLSDGPDSLEVDKEYKGYIASLGASIIQSGLLPALSFYTDLSVVRSNKMTPGQRKNRLLNAVLYVIDRKAQQSRLNLLHYTIAKINTNPVFNVEDPESSFADFRVETTKQRIITKQILNASLAIKLGLRAFKYK